MFKVSVGEIVNESLKVTKLNVTKIEELELQRSRTTFQKIATFAEGLVNGVLGQGDEYTDVTRLADAEFTVLYYDNGKYSPLLEKVNGKFKEVVRTTDENGEFSIDGLPYGMYAVKETKAPRYYDMNTKLYTFELSRTSQEAELVLQDARTLVDAEVVVGDEDGNKLAGVTVKLVDPETNKVAYVAETDEDGVAEFPQIRAGRYIRQVADLEEMYVTPEAKELYLEDDENVTADEVTVKFITGKILINKTDDETGAVVPGCLFKITNEAGETVVEERTDDNGQLLVAGLRYGKYYVEETEAAEGYEKSDLVFEVSITEDGHVYTVDFTNVPTGDIAVALYAIIALVSVAAITVTVKKLRKN